MDRLSFYVDENMKSTANSFFSSMIGWIFLRILVPILIIVWGGYAVCNQSLLFRTSEIKGSPSIALGIGVILIGISQLGMSSEPDARSLALRIRLGLIAVAIFSLIVGVVMNVF